MRGSRGPRLHPQNLGLLRWDFHFLELHQTRRGRQTHDGGESWCFLHATTTHLRGVEMVTNSVAPVVGDNGLILRTNDGGGACQPGPLLDLFVDGFESGKTSAWSAIVP